MQNNAHHAWHVEAQMILSRTIVLIVGYLRMKVKQKAAEQQKEAEDEPEEAEKETEAPSFVNNLGNFSKDFMKSTVMNNAVLSGMAEKKEIDELELKIKKHNSLMKKSSNLSQKEQLKLTMKK